ncbi:2TM domain-containing protein [Fulvivirga kasyanovii]|uniref:2TM domain-containing protein n=1 Tax=Fulvivirga kasyanovii TaxID=396812 RepID=A0ABW9RXJ9_9BACT|nr:2TM domain-containing protein [Fulvivirga kasyanovii]
MEKKYEPLLKHFEDSDVLRKKWTIRSYITKQNILLRQLNYFIVHVVVYFVFNITFILMIFQDISGRWGLLFPVVLWALALIYHGLRIYGVNIFTSKNKKHIWSGF